MKYDRESRKSLSALFQNVETQWRWNKDSVFVTCTLICCELVSAVACSDCDCKGVTTCLVYEFFYFFRTCIAFMTSFYYYFVFDTSQSTKFSFYYNAMSVCVFNNFLGQFNIFFKRFGRSIDHNRCKSSVDTALAKLEAVTVIQVQCDWNLRIFNYCCFY